MKIKWLFEIEEEFQPENMLDETDFIETVLANIEGRTLLSMIIEEKKWWLLNLVQEKLCNNDMNLTEI